MKVWAENHMAITKCKLKNNLEPLILCEELAEAEISIEYLTFINFDEEKEMTLILRNGCFKKLQNTFKKIKRMLKIKNADLKETHCLTVAISNAKYNLDKKSELLNTIEKNMESEFLLMTPISMKIFTSKLINKDLKTKIKEGQ